MLTATPAPTTTPDPHSTSRRMVNWTRWAREYHGRIRHCRSIEWHYKTPQCWWPEDPKTEVDLHDALRVEFAIRTLALPLQKPLVLHWSVYWGKRDMDTGLIPADICMMIARALSRSYRIGINRNKITEQVNRAQLLVQRRLTL
jgi:hypothetical protein